MRLQSRKAFDLLVHQLRTSPRIKQSLSTTRELFVQRVPYQDGGGHPLHLDVLPIVFANLLPALRVLDIAGFPRPPRHPTFYLALSHFKHIASLRLHGIMPSNITPLRQIVCALLRLKELVLDEVVFLSPIPRIYGARLRDISSRNPCRTRLERLEVRAHPRWYASDPNMGIQSFDPMITWLVHSGACTSLSDFVICRVFTSYYHNMCYYSSDLAAKQVDQLLEASGSSLTSFRDESDIRIRGLDYSAYNLVHNTALSHLTLYLIPGLETRVWPLANELHAIFSTVRSHELRYIAIHLKSKAGFLKEVADSPDLRRLHNVVERPCFHALKDVHVKTVGLTDHPPFHNSAQRVDYLAMLTNTIFRPMLKPWHDRGIVSITYAE